MAQILCVVLLFATVCGAAEREELVIWTTKKDPGFDAALREFESLHPGLTVLRALYSDGRDSRKLMTAIVGDASPDVIEQDRFTLCEWAARGVFQPLNEWFEQSGRSADVPAFYPDCWAEAQYGGKLYGVPFTTDVRALFYNEDLLRKAGYRDAFGNVQPPQNWDQLRQYARRLTQRDEHGRLKVLGFAPNYGSSWLYLYGWLNGGEFMSADGRRVTLDDPRIIEALQYMRDLYDDAGGAPEVEAFIGGNPTPELDPFATGRVAMKIDGNWNLANVARFHPNLRFGVAPPPAPAGKKSVTWSGGFAYAIPSKSKHTQRAAELIRFLVSNQGWLVQHEAAFRYAASRGLAYVPYTTAQPDVNERAFERYIRHHSNVPSRVIDAYPIFDQLMESSRFRPISIVGQQLWDEHVRAIDAVVRGHESAAEALRRSSARVQETLDRVQHPTAGPKLDLNRWSVILTSLAVVAMSVLYWRIAQHRIARHHFARGELCAAAVFVAPWMLGFLCLTIGPIIASLLYSFCRFDAIQSAQWIGLSNFRRLLFEDPMVWKSLSNTAYMLIGVPLSMCVGLAIALLLNHSLRGLWVYRTIFYLPVVVPIVASSILWMWMFNPSNGLINGVLQAVGARSVPLWLASPDLVFGSKAALLIMGLWTSGASMVIWLAGLKSIPPTLYEAARIDGAGTVRQLTSVTLPMLRPFMVFNFVIGIIAAMQLFTPAFIMTGGGPADSTLFYAYHLFNSAFRYFELGYASALAWVLLLITFAVTCIAWWLSRRWTENQAV